MIQSNSALVHAKPLGLILYEGPSLIDGQPIAVIATGFQRRTANSKTGDMVQTWILRSDMNPLEAIHTGQDVSICGNCPLRGMLDKQQRRTVNRRRACYVNVHQAPLAVYRAYRRGRYEPFDSAQHLALFQGRMLRLGCYGDPVAAPYAYLVALGARRPWSHGVHAPMGRRSILAIPCVPHGQRRNPGRCTGGAVARLAYVPQRPEGGIASAGRIPLSGQRREGTPSYV